MEKIVSAINNILSIPDNGIVSCVEIPSCPTTTLSKINSPIKSNRTASIKMIL